MQTLDDENLTIIFHHYFNIDGRLGFLLGNLIPFSHDMDLTVIDLEGFLEIDNFSLFIDI